MTGRLQGKRAIVTGAAGSIGAATVRIFLREGARVVLADLDDAGETLAAELRAAGRDASFVRSDVSDEGAMATLFERAIEHLGGLDILVSNAGLQREDAIESLSAESWDRTMAVNLRSVFLGARLAIPHLRESKGNIVNMASAAGVRGPAGLAAYSASKGAVITFTKTLASELGRDGIRVNAVSPGWIDTPFNQPIIDRLGGRAAQAKVVEAGVPLRRQGTPEEVGEVIAFLASDAASFVNAQAIGIDGGAS